jgi:hypothetical protein
LTRAAAVATVEVCATCACALVSGQQFNRERRMPQTMIFGPFLATMVLTLVVWTYMYVRRIHFILKSGVRSQDLAASGALARLSPPAVANPSDNLKNLFEIPVIFYAISLYLYATSQVDPVYVEAGWVFVIFRAAHSAVHATFNLVMLRFGVYAVASLAVWLMVVRAGLSYAGVGG